ncbi:sortase [Anaerolineales bacterium HSG24]|nr:sortase [Anaerolineales bacterium HSG24]
MRLPALQIVVEQIALLFASLVWTVVILGVICLFWAYQDIQAREQLIQNPPPELIAQIPTATPFPTPTVWSPPPTLPPSPTIPPTPVPTRVVKEPDLLPKTLNPDDPTPVIIYTEEEAEAYGVELENPAQEETSAESARLPTITPTGSSDSAVTPSVVASVVASVVTPVVTPVVTSVEATAIPIEPLEPTATIGIVAAIVGTSTPIPTLAPTAPPPTGQTGQTENATGGSVLPTYLKIPSVSIDSSVVTVGWDIVEQNGQQYSVWQVADNAVGWHKTSAPLGQNGNTVMTGHHNVDGEVFRDLVNVEVGDKIMAYAGHQVYEYEVTFKTIIKEAGESLDVQKKNAQWIDPTDDERITLVTCWPYTSNTHRVIVVAKPVS